jgi:F-type H+-transporting ATPase subunit a
MKFYLPLEQFELNVLIPFNFFNFDFSFNTMSFYLILVVFFIYLFLYFGISGALIVPTMLQTLVEYIYKFLYDMILQQAGKGGQRFFVILFTTFFFILFSNLLGLIPYGFTTTSHIMITLSVAFMFNFGFILLGFNLHGFKFLNLFVPSGAPVFLLPLIIVIEIVSYLIRTVSLSVRLFANMLAGHTLLYIMSSFVMAFINSSYLILALIPFVIILAVYVLELGIAFIQAYVFIILLTIYLNDSLHPSH